MTTVPDSEVRSLPSIVAITAERAYSDVMNNETIRWISGVRDPVAVLGIAVEAAAAPLRHLDIPGRPRPIPGEVANRVLRAFVGTAKPVQAQLAELVRADPDGAVAKALSHVRRAFEHFCTDDNALVEARAELLAAHAALTGEFARSSGAGPIPVTRSHDHDRHIPEQGEPAGDRGSAQRQTGGRISTVE